jgi:hypothetical protein
VCNSRVRFALLLKFHFICLFITFIIYLFFSVSAAKKGFQPEFDTLIKCIDDNDYRMHECLEQEKAFYGVWNKHHGYTASVDKK